MTAFLAPLAVDVFRLTIWLGLLALVFVPLERFFAVKPNRVIRDQVATDLAYYFLSSLLPTFLLGFPLAALAIGLHGLLPSSYLVAVAHLPIWALSLAVLFVGELGFYWGHRLTHSVPLLWRFHAVHHSAEHLDWLVNGRAHPVDMIFIRLCGLTPIYALGLAQMSHGRGMVAVLTVFVTTFWGFFIHANIRWRFGPFERILATPAFHHWHHTNDEHRDHNFASTLPWIDSIFGTFYLPRSWPAEYGIDAKLPAGLVPQLWGPFTGPLAMEEAAQPPIDKAIDLAPLGASRPAFSE